MLSTELPEKKATHFSPLAWQGMGASPGVRYHPSFPRAGTRGTYGDGEAQVLFSTR